MVQKRKRVSEFSAREIRHKLRADDARDVQPRDSWKPAGRYEFENHILSFTVGEVLEQPQMSKVGRACSFCF